MYSSGLSFGYTQGSQPEPTATQTRAPRQEEKQTCVPVTVRVLQDALAARSDPEAELQIHGGECGSVALVGVVEDLVQQTTVVEFSLNDASGRIKVRQFEATVEGLANGRYVSLVGSLRTAPAVHISAMSLRLVESADEVSYHMIEAAHAALNLRRGGSVAAKLPVKQVEMTPASKQRPADPPTPSKETPDAPMMAVETAAQSAPAPLQSTAPAITSPKKVTELHGAELRAAIVKTLETCSEEGIGIHVNVLHEKLEGSAPFERVRDMISQLVDNGDAFSTIDDDHFGLV